MNINDLTLGEAKEIARIFSKERLDGVTSDHPARPPSHSPLGRRCLVRTYSAGVHIGDVVYVHPHNSMEVKLENALRLWKWEGGGLSLSAVAANGIKGGRLNKTGEIYLTNAIEFIPTTPAAEKTYAKFIED